VRDAVRGARARRVREARAAPRRPHAAWLFAARTPHLRALTPPGLRFGLGLAAHIARGAIEAVAGKVVYPIVPGHELAGVCTAVGSGVTKFKVGDHVGVGCMVDACLECASCRAGEEQKCSKGNIATYNGHDKFGRAQTYPPGGATLGGYTTRMVVHERFGILVPQGYPLEFAGPVSACPLSALRVPLRWR
jgi:D-arabinose 1-dehydrogenase-like Zn-dependent alcohol dehydrogenase